MSGLTRSYDVHGLRLDVEVETAPLLDPVESVLSPFATTTQNRECFLLRIGHGSAPEDEGISADLHRVASECLPNGICLVRYVGEGLQRTDLQGLGSIEIRRTRGEGRITVAPGAEWCLERGCVVLTLCELLGDADQHVIHSGSLCIERDGRREALLIAGSRSAGKTTTSLALARTGMKLMGDDTCFVVRREGSRTDELIVWGLLLEPKVHRETLKLLPWLERFARRCAQTADEYIVEAREAIGVGEPVELAARAIFILDPRNDVGHRITPLDKRQAVMYLVRESVRAPDPTCHDRAGRAFRALTDLVHYSETYLLSVGPDIETLGDEILSVLR